MITRIIPFSKDKTTFVAINSQHKLLKRQIGKSSKMISIGKPEDVQMSFSIYDTAKRKFNVDPCAVYPYCGNYLITCINLANDFSVYDLSNFSLECSVIFRNKVSLIVFVIITKQILVYGYSCTC